MGERAQRGYEEAERDAFQALPRGARFRANLVAFLAVSLVVAFAFVLGFGYWIF